MTATDDRSTDPAGPGGDVGSTGQGGSTGRGGSPARRAPGYVICLMFFLAADVFSGTTTGLPLPIGPDRILFAFFLLLLILDTRAPWRRLRLTAPIVVAVAALVWAMWSAYMHGTLGTRYGAFALLDRLAIPYLLFALAPVALSTRRSRIILLQFLVLLGLYLGFTAIFEMFGPHALVWPKFILDPNVGISFGRARGPFLASDADAAAMATCFFGACALWAVTTSRTWRWWAAISVIVCLTGVFLAVTRAEWIGTALGAIVAGALVPRIRRKLPAILLLVGVAIGVAIVAVPSLHSTVTSRASDVRSVDDRKNTDAGGLRALESDPLFGIGWVRFEEESPRYVRQARDYPITNVDIEIHNVPLSRLAELGLLGGGLWLLSALLGPVAAMFVGRRDDPLDEAYRVSFVGIAIVWATAIQFSPFPYPLPNSLVWLLAGVVMAPLVGRSARAPGQHTARWDDGTHLTAAGAR